MEHVEYVQLPDRKKDRQAQFDMNSKQSLLSEASIMFTVQVR